VYCRAKIDLMLLRQAPLSLEARQQPHAEVHNWVKAGHGRGEPVTVALALPTQQTPLCGPLTAKLVYRLPMSGGLGAPILNASSVIPNPARVRSRES
jgi:hypothetical protein